jgi:hypothetical protein
LPPENLTSWIGIIQGLRIQEVTQVKRVQPLFELLSLEDAPETFRIDIDLPVNAKSRLLAIVEASGESDIRGLILSALLAYDQSYRDSIERIQQIVGDNVVSNSGD